MGYSFNVLGLVYELLKDQKAFVTSQPPADLARRLPALIIGSDAPQMVQNYRSPGSGAKVQVVLTAVSGEDEGAFALIDSAYSAMWDRKHKTTRWGWVSYIEEVQAPALVVSDQAAGHLFQYQSVLNLIIRK